MQFTASQTAVSGTIENSLAKILVIATGKAVNPTDMNDLLASFNQYGHFGGIAQLVETYMNQQVANNGGDLIKTVAQAMANATGDSTSWTTAKTEAFISSMGQIGVNTWSGLYEHIITNPTSEYGGKLDVNIKNYLQAYGISPGSGQDTVTLPVDFSSQFIDPQPGDVYSHIAIRDFNGNLAKEFEFNTPSFLSTPSAQFFDFGGGDKTLALTQDMYSVFFSMGKDNFFINFSQGDQVVFIDNSKYMPEGMTRLNTNEAKFFNTVYYPNDSQSPYDPSNGFWQQGDSLVALETLRQFNGDLLSFPFKGVPEGLKALGDPYMQNLPGITYGLNLSNSDGMTDGRVIIVGSNPTFLTSDNFHFNDPAYAVP